jgi:rhodanese-related sulfurtransferase
MAHRTYADLVADAKTRITEVSPREVLAMRERGDHVVLIDIREPNEWNLGYIPGAVHIPRGILESNIENHAQRDATVVLYCAGGSRSALAAEVLTHMGFTDARSMERGFRGWVEDGGEIDG